MRCACETKEMREKKRIVSGEVIKLWPGGVAAKKSVHDRQRSRDDNWWPISRRPASIVQLSPFFGVTERKDARVPSAPRQQLAEDRLPGQLGTTTKWK